MSTTTTYETPMVPIGNIQSVSENETIGAILGSCIGVILYCPNKKVGVFSHVVLPNSSGRKGLPGKFADTAIPKMIEILGKQGVLKTDLFAKVTGGSNMFGSSGPMQIGLKNYEAVKQILEKESISIVAESVGGKKGRRVFFDPNTTALTIEIVGQNPTVI